MVSPAASRRVWRCLLSSWKTGFSRYPKMRIALRKSSRYECSGLEERFEGSVRTESTIGRLFAKPGGEGGGSLG